jgi:hypothetical protein
VTSHLTALASGPSSPGPAPRAATYPAMLTNSASSADGFSERWAAMTSAKRAFSAFLRALMSLASCSACAVASANAT